MKYTVGRAYFAIYLRVSYTGWENDGFAGYAIRWRDPWTQAEPPKNRRIYVDIPLTTWSIFGIALYADWPDVSGWFWTMVGCF
jgi:hypothetical protein